MKNTIFAAALSLASSHTIAEVKEEKKPVAESNIIKLDRVVLAKTEEPLVISRYPLVYGLQKISIPSDASVLSVAHESGQLFAYAAYTPKKEGTKMATIQVVNTGEYFPFKPPMRFIGTVADSAVVLHVFSDN